MNFKISTIIGTVKFVLVINFFVLLVTAISCAVGGSRILFSVIPEMKNNCTWVGLEIKEQISKCFRTV